MVGIVCFQCAGGAAGLISGGELGSHMPCGADKKKISRFEQLNRLYLVDI